MKRTLAKPRREWQGFQPTAYTLDAKEVWTLPLQCVQRASDGEKQSTPVMLGEILESLRGQKTLKGDSVLETTITTDAGEVVLGGAPFCRAMLEALLSLREQGADGLEAAWFWYDSDSVTDDPHDSYSFFVVHSDRIVHERVSFSDYGDSGFDPSVFKADADSSSIWFDEEAWRDANIRFWYRKFYRETRTGQLMVLRSDEPELHHYPEGRWRADLAFVQVRDLFSKMYFLLVALAFMALLGLILLWK